MPEPLISIVLLNWNNYSDALGCVRSIQTIKYPNYRILLVDNGSSDGSANKLGAAFPEIDLIINKNNLGFAAGNNVGIKHALENGADYFLLLNNDTVVEAGFLAEMVKTARSDPKIGIVGPKIFFYGTKKIWYAGGFLNRATGFTYHRGENEVDCGKYDRQEEVDFISGCAMLVKKEVFEKIGGLDEDYFHSHEDSDFCLRAKRAGFSSIYCPSAVVEHKLAVSSGGRRSPFYFYYRTRNHLIFKHKQGLKAPFFWPKFIFLAAKRIFGSLAVGSFLGAWATILGIFDFYVRKWGKGSGGKFVK